MDELFSYQKEAVEWIKNRKFALLALEMGLGKSAVTITAADIIGVKRILVIAPAVARLNWLREFEKFSSLKRNFTVLKSAKDIIPPNHSVIISFDLATRLGFEALGVFDLVIIDEVHYLKNSGAKRTKSIFGKEGIIHGQSTKTKIWVLSGTPCPNNASELWPLLFTFGKTSLRYESFVERFCVQSQRRYGTKIRSQITGTKRESIPELRRLLAQVMLRRTKSEVGHMLPKIFYSNIVVEEGKIDFEIESSLAQYVLPVNRIDELEAKLKSELAQVKKALNTRDIKELEGLAKSVSTLRRYTGIQKVEKVAELVKQELDAKLYDKIVIFAIHRDVIEGLRVRLKDYNPLTLYGGTRFDSANKHIDKFQQFGKFKVFIGNITACGIAINLTSAHNVLMIEQEWTPAANAQAIARCHRHGQTKPVTVRMVGLANSIDEKISKILSKKTRELTEIFDDAKSTDTLPKKESHELNAKKRIEGTMKVQITFEGASIEDIVSQMQAASNFQTPVVRDHEVVPTSVAHDETVATMTTSAAKKEVVEEKRGPGRPSKKEVLKPVSVKNKLERMVDTTGLEPAVKSATSLDKPDALTPPKHIERDELLQGLVQILKVPTLGRAKVQEILNKFGAENVSAVDVKRYHELKAIINQTLEAGSLA